MIRVGRCIYDSNGKPSYPSYEDFTSVVVLMKSHSQYGDLGPYLLKDEKGRIMENVWQFSKIYKKVPKSVQYYSRFDKTVIWSHDAETHIDDNGNITLEYWKWREKGMNNKYFVRYPVGFKYRGNCEYAMSEDNVLKKLNYVEARKAIYVPLYCRLARAENNVFLSLKNRLKKGENLLIIEVDGPHQESIEYYKDTYEVSDRFIIDDTIIANDENMSIMLDSFGVQHSSTGRMLNDDKHPFGHGYCLAMALLDIDELVLNM